jgi:MFS family permease
LLVLFTAGLLFWSSLTTLLPTLSLYIKDLGATKHQIGIVMGAFAVGLLIFRPRLGRLADQRGRRIVLLIGLVVVAIAPLGYLFTTSIPFLMVIRAFHGLSIAAFTTGYSALVADLSPPRNRGELIGYMSLVNPIGMAIGPALGGFVQSWAGYTPLFLLSAGLGFVGFLCILWVVAPPLQTREPGFDLPADEPFWRILLSPRLRTPTLMMLLIGLVFGVLSTFVPLFIQEAKVNLNAGLFYTAAAISSFGVRLPTGKASDRYGRGRFISFSLVLYTTAMLLLWTAHSQVGFLLAGVMEGAGSGIFIPMVVTLVADRSQPHEWGRLFGLCLAGFDLGMAIAGPTLGFLADAVGYRGLFGFAASLTVLALLLFISQNSKDLIHSLRFALGAGKDLYALPHKSVG